MQNANYTYYVGIRKFRLRSLFDDLFFATEFFRISFGKYFEQGKCQQQPNEENSTADRKLLCAQLHCFRERVKVDRFTMLNIEHTWYFRWRKRGKSREYNTGTCERFGLRKTYNIESSLWTPRWTVLIVSSCCGSSTIWSYFFLCVRSHTHTSTKCVQGENMADISTFATFERFRKRNVCVKPNARN